jgi:predicted Zn-dependent peptidase
LRSELSWGDLEAYLGRVRAVDGAKVKEAAARSLDPEKAAVVLVRPRG